MKLDDSFWVEADITIGGHELTFAQAMTLRVAVSQFLMELQNGSELREQLGKTGDGYFEQGRFIENLIIGSISEQRKK